MIERFTHDAATPIRARICPPTSAEPPTRAISPAAMIEAEHLTKDYGGVVAVSDLSFHVGKGEVVGFLGPNGAGKTTTLRMLAGFIGATSGRVRINGYDIVEQSLSARRSLGYMPESTPLYPELRVREYLAFRAAIKQVPRRRRKPAIERALGLAVLDEVADTLILHLSKGYRQRVGLADALLASPPLLILDEPTIGLDPNQIRDVRKVIRELGDDHTLLVSTHILSEVEAVCDRAMVIHRGRLVASGTISELRERMRSDTLQLTLRDPEQQLASVLGGVPEAALEGEVRADEGDPGLQRVKLRIAPSAKDPGAVIERLVASLVTAGVSVREVSPGQATLEDVFAQLTRDESPASERPPEDA